MLTTFHVSGLIFVPKFSGKEKKRIFILILDKILRREDDRIEVDGD
jgi:hypothetical protein